MEQQKNTFADQLFAVVVTILIRSTCGRMLFVQMYAVIENGQINR